MLCGNCQDVCNFNAILKLDVFINVFPELCHSCYACSELCSSNALPMVKKKTAELKWFKNENLDFVESRLDIGEESAVPVIKDTKKFVEENLSEKDVIIFDSPPGTSCPVIEATKDADLVVLVTEPTPFGLYDLELAVKTMNELNKKIVVVINKSDTNNDKLITDYCNKNNIEIIGKIK